MKIQNLLLCIALNLFQIITAQTYEFHNSINFGDVADGRDLPDGITWFKPAPLSYGIFRTNGSWSGPNYQQLKLSFDTGIIIDGGYAHGRSGTVLQPNGGNVGIGTSNPESKLVVMNNGYGISFNPEPLASGLAFNRNATNGAIYDLSRAAWQFSARDEMFTFEGYNGALHQLFSLLKNGNFGIGTFSPIAKLDVRGNILVWGTSIDNVDDNGQINFENSNHGIRRIGNVIDIFTSGHSERGISFTLRSLNASTGLYTEMNQAMKIAFDGNVGIGTTNPTSKLTVAGNITSREVKVTVDAGADFVFEKDYNLPSLELVNQFIKENKHLPEIASAKEMQKDGINLSEMNIKLLQKIEELTLYMIEMKKENENMKKENDLMKINQIELMSRVKSIENK